MHGNPISREVLKTEKSVRTGVKQDNKQPNKQLNKRIFYIMKVKIKKLVPNAVIPKYAKEGDAGLDLTAVSREFDDKNNVTYKTGLAIEIPYGYVGLIFPRSSISNKNQLLTNSVGLIDAGYRGEITLKFKAIQYASQFCKPYEVGERVGQLVIMPYPQIELIESNELSESERGDGNYGSTGK